MDEWVWGFKGFTSTESGRPVQSWFDELVDEDRDAIVDTLLHLERIISRPWPESSFDPLDNAGGISEIKVPEFRSERNGKVERITLRIYGYFGPSTIEHAYTFLHGKDKKVKNDEEGKRIAKSRLDQITARIADIHEFNFR